MKYYCYNEPIFAEDLYTVVGNTLVYKSEEDIIRESKHKDLDSQKIIDEFVVINWAWEVSLEVYVKETMKSTECILECFYDHELKACGSCFRTLQEIAEAGRSKLKDNK